MADVIYLGQPGHADSGSWFKDLLPIAILGALAIGAYYLVTSGIISNLGGSIKSAVSTVTGGSQTANTQTNVPAPVALQAESFGQMTTTPGQYTNPGVTGATVFTGYGIGSLFVNTGAGFANNLFPLGDVNTVSAPINTQEQATVIKNECNEPYYGWWQAVPGLCASVGVGG